MHRDMTLTRLIAETKHIVLKGVKRHLYARFHYAVDDVVQEVYIKAYKALKKKSSTTKKINGWIYTISRNEAIRMNKICSREQQKQERLKETYTQSSYTQQSNSFLSEIKSLLTELPTSYQNVLQLSLQGYKIQEISKILNLSQGTVKSRTSRGRELLSRLYNQK